MDSIDTSRRFRPISEIPQPTVGHPVPPVAFGAEQWLEFFGVTVEESPLRTYESERSFNQKDQLESITLGKRTPHEHIFCFEYNTYGDLITKYQPNSQEPIKYQYDNSGNLKVISYLMGEEEMKYQFSYDKANNLNQVQLGSSATINYSFDAHAMPLSETVKDEFGLYQVSRTYDGEGKIQALQLPDGSFVEYTYEGPFVKNVQRFNKDKKELYDYQVVSRDQMGNILEEILPGHVGQKTQVWDKAGRRIYIATDFFQDKVLKDGYDPLHNLKKREIIFDEEKTTVDYNYNALSQLISEKGEIESTYSYDSVGNRLKRNGSAYKVNELNQLTEAEGASYTFDHRGNIATKIIGTKTWAYQTNPEGQIVSITDPDQNIVKFTYDGSGRRLTKRIEAKGKREKIFRFFYLGDTEIGSVDEKGIIIELKIPSNPNHPEAPSIAIELRKEIYVPIYDLQGNIACLIDHQRRKVVETYRYSVYGEEDITDVRGSTISDSSVGNPWRYQGKRVDKEIGLIYFGYRYYDPKIGRWLTPDPLGTIDGPNLYAYAHNNPMTYIDYFGLASVTNENLQPCVCGYCEREEGFCHSKGSDPTHDINKCACMGISCIHKRACSIVKTGRTIASSLGGTCHGIVDFMIGSIHDLQTAAVYMGSSDLETSLHERALIIEAVEQSQVNRMDKVENWIMNAFSIDHFDAIYQSFRSKTTMGLEVGSLVAGGYGAVKGVMVFNRLARMPMQIAKLSAKGVHSIEGALKVRKFTYTNTAAKHFTEFVKKGPNAGKLSRPYMKSQLTIEEIMTAGKPIPDPGGIPGGLRWDVPGVLRGSEGTWELVIHPETNVIYHFNFK